MSSDIFPRYPTARSIDYSHLKEQSLPTSITDINIAD